MRIKTAVVYSNGIEKEYLSPELPEYYTFEQCVNALKDIIQPSYESDRNGYLSLNTDYSSIVHIRIKDTSSIEFIKID